MDALDLNDRPDHQDTGQVLALLGPDADPKALLSIRFFEVDGLVGLPLIALDDPPPSFEGRELDRAVEAEISPIRPEHGTGGDGSKKGNDQDVSSDFEHRGSNLWGFKLR